MLVLMVSSIPNGCLRRHTDAPINAISFIARLVCVYSYIDVLVYLLIFWSLSAITLAA